MHWSRGCRGASATPKVLICRKSGQITENVRKIPEVLHKVPDNTAKNGTQRCLNEKLVPTTWVESHEDLIFEIIPKMICVEGNTHTKSCPKFFGQVWGNAGKNVLHFYLFLLLCLYVMLLNVSCYW